MVMCRYNHICVCMFVIYLFCPSFSWQQYDIDSIENTFLINRILAILNFSAYLCFKGTTICLKYENKNKSKNCLGYPPPPFSSLYSHHSFSALLFAPHDWFLYTDHSPQLAHLCLSSPVRDQGTEREIWTFCSGIHFLVEGTAPPPHPGL